MTTEHPTPTAQCTEPGSTLPGWYADPALVTIQGQWWLYPTTDGLPGWAADSFRAFSSPDLVNWTDHGDVLRLGDDVQWVSERAWAPAIVERNGRFYFYFTADHNIGVAIGSRPEGPFVDIGRPLIAAGDFEGAMIDPSVFVDDDGTSYLYWGNSVAYGVQLNEDMVSFERSAVRSWRPFAFREAAWVHRRGDHYYLTWSEGDTRSEDYRLRYATGLGPLGPWDHQGVFLRKDRSRGILATGHHAIANVPGTDNWVIAFHRFGIPDGHGYQREVIFAPLCHLEDGRLATVEVPREPLRVPLANAGSPVTRETQK